MKCYNLIIKKIYCFCFVLISTITTLNAATVGDLVWYDINQNGIQNAGEPGMPSVRMILYNSTTNYPLDTTYTNATGNYLFTDLPSGNYYIVASQMPYGYIFTLPNIGSSDAHDNDACPMGRCTLFSLSSTEINYNFDFGLVVDATACSLSEIKCCDIYPNINTYCFSEYLGLDDSISSVTASSLASVNISSQGCITYAQNAGVLSSTIDTVHVKICNSYGQCHEVCLYVSKDCVIAPPFIVPCNDTINTCLAIYPASINLCVPKCLREDGDAITNASSTFHCEVVINSDSCVTYTSFPGMPLGYIDTITIEFVNLMGHEHRIIYYLQIGCVNDTEHAPQWVDTIMSTNVSVQYFQTTLNTCKDISVKVLEIDGGDQLTYSIVQPAHGVALYNFDNTAITYCPDYNYKGIDTIYLKVCDSLAPVECDVLTLLIEVPNLTPSPVACFDTIKTCANLFPLTRTFCIDYCNWLPGDSIKSASTFFNCSLDFIGDSCIKYTPLPGMIATTIDTLKVKLCSPITGQCHWMVYIIDIGCDNVTADNKPYFTNTISGLPINIFNANCIENTCITLPISMLDFDNNDAINYTIQPTTGSIIEVNQTLNYINYCPPNGYVGLDSFSIELCDSLLPVQCRKLWINIHINEKKCNDTIPTCQGLYPNSKTICPVFCKLNAAPTSITYSSSIVCSVSLFGTNCYNIIQFPGTANTTNNVTFIGCDASGNCDTVVYAITVAAGVTCADVTLIQANSDAINITPNAPNIISISANDVCSDCTIALISSNMPQQGNVIINNDVTVMYIPNADFNTIDCFSYLLCNNYTSICDTAIVCVSVDSNAIEANSDNWLISNCEYTTTSILLQTNDNNTTANTTFAILQSTANGTLAYNNTNQTITYNPTNNYSGTDQFIYQLCNDGKCDTALVNIVWTCPNTPPVLVINGSTSNVINVNAMEPFLICTQIIDEQTNLQNSINTNGNGTIDTLNDCIIYTPNTSFATDTLMLTVCDTFNLCDTVLVIFSTNAIPTIEANNDFDTIAVYNSTTINIVANDSLMSNTNMVFTIIDSFIYGTCTLDSLGQLIYTNNTFFGNETNYIDELTYLICNGINCDTASVFIYITGNFECDSLQIFNAISPNGDQINDVFIIPCSYAHIDNRLMIFNRWGQLVFDESKYQNNWSGEWQNTKIKVPSGTYYYIFEKNQFKNEPNNRLSGFLYIK